MQDDDDGVSSMVVEAMLKKLTILLDDNRHQLPLVHIIYFRSFRDELCFMLDTIRCCESLDDPGPQHSVWLNGTRELAYDVEDWVDLYAHALYRGSEQRFFSRLLGWLRRDAHKLTTLPARHVIASEIRHFKMRCHEMNEKVKRYGLLNSSPSFPAGPVDPYQATLFVDTTGCIVGLDGPIQRVVKMVTDAGDKAELKIVSIVGMPGSGKTTLANAVYRRLTEQNCFQCQTFVSVGLKPDLRKTLMDMHSDLANGPCADEDTNELIARIREILENKRYLAVVDDLWSQKDWEDIKICFPENSLGSRIITTTRNSTFAMAGDCIYNIGLLNETDSRKLILNRAFGTGYGCPKDLEDVVSKITRRCGGLPLALVTLASMLADQSSTCEWERLAESRWSWIPHPHAETMKRILNLCYNDLPPRLRTYLLYLSIFPENYVVDTARLVRLWITEGLFFLEIRGAEAISWDLNELISRNLMQSLHWNHDDIPRYCRLHPVIHDFLVCKSMEEKFATVVKDQGDQNFPINNGTVHRVSLQSNSIRVQAVLRNDSADLSRARSISVFGQASSTPHLTDLKVVRVLDLEGCDGPVCLDGLSKLLHLRYVSLRGTGVSELPATIGELRCLQTLDVSSTTVKKLPPSIGALLCLRYLNIWDTSVSELPAKIGELRFNLKAILIGGKGRFNSVETVTRLPNVIQHFRCLEKLGTIDIRVHHARFVEAVGGLDHLRVLKITWSSQQSNEKAYREALVSSIEKWSQLEYLTIHCGFLCSMDFLGSVPNPPQRLKKFKVTAGRFAVIPQWISWLWSLSFVQITVSKLGSDELRILKILPRLKCLILGLEFIPRETIVIENDGFTELRRFSVDCPVPWLTFSTEAMRWIKHLELKFCSGPASQKSVPSGINNLRSLTEVVLCYNQKWCANSSSVKMTVAAVKEEVSKHRNPIELVINDTRVNVQQAEEAAEIPNKAERGGKAKDDVEVAGEGTSKISSSSEIEEIEDDAEHGL